MEAFPGPQQNDQENEGKTERILLLQEMQHELGFFENETMRELGRRFAIEVENRAEIYTKWTLEAELEIGKITNHEKGRYALLGMHLAQARLYFSAGLIGDFNEMVQEEIDCISMQSPDEFIERLEKMKVT